MNNHSPVALPTYIESKIRDVILPVEYTSACRAIALCRTLDEAKHWSDKAEALAAWAKIYKNNQAAIESKRLKLHAYRRMSELAEDIRPTDRKKRTTGGHLPGARSLLIEHGLSREVVKNIRRIGAIPKAQFKKIVESPKPPGICAAADAGVGRSGAAHRRTTSQSWRLLSQGSVIGGINPRRFLSLFCRRQSAKELARGLQSGEVKAARLMMQEIAEWLDEFDQYMPKELP